MTEVISVQKLKAGYRLVDSSGNRPVQTDESDGVSLRREEVVLT